ncbi:glutaminase A [Hyphomicrobium sp. 99]|uniref:glutaminase A n=1 Tax=Hyphomicrobium sp. 99 TaxID=1163419 RepID=UPI001FD8E8FC|nr:glutaminase A [Hyphomicrobium sp. 99]
MAFWKKREAGGQSGQMDDVSRPTDKSELIDAKRGEALDTLPASSDPLTFASRELAGETTTTSDHHSQVDRMLTDIYEQARPLTDGMLADYIPELAKVPPDSFGIAIATTKGQVHTIGDADVEFTIQSTSKALTFCMALELSGRKEVLSCVGVEPSGDPFNAIEFNPVTRRPFNPMVNAGAIAISGMLRDTLGPDAAFDLVLARFSQAAGRQLKLNEDVYRSEALTGHRNRAIAYLLLSVGALKEPVEPALDLYFKQCSIMVTATDLAFMGATIANLGVHPVTNQHVFDIEAVRDVQSVMFTCGMYDYSGGWAYEVGIPAKSGVGGGILGVVNRQLGVGTYSPRLDSNGNSVRGIASFRMMSDSLGLHSFDLTNAGSGFVSSFFTSDTADA